MDRRIYGKRLAAKTHRSATAAVRVSAIRAAALAGYPTEALARAATKIRIICLPRIGSSTAAAKRVCSPLVRGCF